MPIITLEIDQTTNHLLNELCSNLSLSPAEVVTNALKIYQNEQIAQQRLKLIDEGYPKIVSEAGILERIKAQQ